MNGRYPLSNACGQLNQSYQDYHCPDHERHMECPVDPDMEITAVTNAKWYVLNLNKCMFVSLCLYCSR